jgi:hypothetical protein
VGRRERWHIARSQVLLQAPRLARATARDFVRRASAKTSIPRSLRRLEKVRRCCRRRLRQTFAMGLAAFSCCAPFTARSGSSLPQVSLALPATVSTLYSPSDPGVGSHSSQGSWQSSYSLLQSRWRCSATRSLALDARVTPNPSLKLTRYGRHCKPGLSQSNHCLSPGLQYLPTRAA